MVTLYSEQTKCLNFCKLTNPRVSLSLKFKFGKLASRRKSLGKGLPIPIYRLYIN